MLLNFSVFGTALIVKAENERGLLRAKYHRRCSVVFTLPSECACHARRQRTLATEFVDVDRYTILDSALPRASARLVRSQG